MKRISVAAILIIAILLNTIGVLAEPIQAYLTCNQSYLAPGTPVTWTAVAQGGTNKFQYRFVLYCLPDSNPNYYTIAGTREYSASSSATFTPKVHGNYHVNLYVKDSSGQVFEYYSQKYETSKDNLLSQKVKAIAAQCNASASGSYAKALFMHDWLTRNANYSSSSPSPNSAEGVLLYGAGVCQSYALAYQMLLSEVGVSSIFIGGTAGGGNHAWNLVKMGDYWYHVDVTWDDPIGGSPNRNYFGLPDAFMRRDHNWTGKYPPCVGTASYFGSLVSGWFQVNGEWYYLANNGVIQTGWLNLANSWYYMNQSGVMQTGWISENSNWFYLDSNGVMTTGSKVIDGKLYSFKSSGVMIEETSASNGWLQENGSWCYYMDGVRQTGWLNLSNKWYYLNTNGAMKTGWVKTNGDWYYMNSSGVMKTGWLKLGNDWYYLFGNGAMATGNHTIEGVVNYFNASGIWQG